MHSRLFKASFVCFSLTLLHVMTAAQSTRPEYGIREEQPSTGTRIRREVVKGSPIPINKRYHELSEQEKASLHSWYEDLQASDEPPFPMEGIKPIHDAVRKLQDKLLISGELTLFATVGQDGLVSQVKAVGSPSAEMTKYVASVLFLTKFKPALCRGQPCQMDFPFVYVFEVR